ncbi:hypothetical protein A3J20_03270 [Candidatus Gottesmanbacteria bacterium RIFCSPLOWO2_02_FULL_42_29]|uniref:Uncharacterized protein n=1 Tax=Candidatus Gottesmanbacteria bacterium RIFCSPLOWO2_01_FULL_42_22 TaxID=1798391 RepID=A0A1F6BDM4_9BACT|nr:MAG: hypothetical protein A2781_04755 [Candidatus Gottesmanbacteria bacterium RIFCSPHIGHO2_01_FULL_42_27]OGG21688.1 MAG: hypothetical protein A3E72_04420 [Candidatus Gottesmanbacteria bacterium RIFCSPHIGHO2_12_FULL_43_26]OGG34227.1 MAG: hypothetical protein A3G68_02885 [Candidatus Gottesmanbacteria bacterium RIFCSPLOWO2_12_FULL_42_10]OGG35025.1 MAG: hypothetical protein A2968_00120 [Candidatus Gottesmanbacteria bacterium RIFCSPLOWO2_01_FULL_42_22]OGG36416.1 MAG: hypothetical protein A3J20_03
MYIDIVFKKNNVLLPLFFNLSARLPIQSGLMKNYMLYYSHMKEEAELWFNLAVEDWENALLLWKNTATA